ncbi:unnamed protein product [Cylindrotheca closterium]|uniref:Uncharacterized protein n=1 Tax=Cylindrotheca closterium TaxID=2856 RepID=A0AAD2FVI1_9STRA|nr:unnamed protein product [Cylindrotheca closterium]
MDIVGGTGGTGLHARKHHKGSANNHADDTDDSHPQSPHRRRSRRYSRYLPSFLHSEVGVAFEIVVVFLVCGFLLGYLVLSHQHRHVMHFISDPLGHLRLHGRAGFRHHFYSGQPRTVTVVLPSVVNPKNRKRRLDSIFETWGPNARAIYVVHNVSEFPQADHHAVISEKSQPEDPYSYPQILLVPPSISFNDGLPRLNYVIRTVYEKVNPDFAFFVNDHTFVIPEHLCKYLEDKHPEEDMYHGHAMKNQKDIFNSGAAGYVLSRKTMQSLVQAWDKEDPTCLLKNGAKWLQGNPGLVTSKCLKEVLHVEAVDTRYHGKYHRFHAFPLTRVVSGAVDDWYKKKHEDMDKMMKTDASYNHLDSGVGCCAQETISFHYVEYSESRALFSTREALIENPHMTDHELKKEMIAKWPKDFKEIGGYSRGLPKEENKDDWETLLIVMRRISSRHTQREC